FLRDASCCTPPSMTCSCPPITDNNNNTATISMGSIMGHAVQFDAAGQYKFVISDDTNEMFTLRAIISGTRLGTQCVEFTNAPPATLSITTNSPQVSGGPITVTLTVNDICGNA